MAFDQNYTVGRGRLFFDERDATGRLTGERYIGNTPTFNIELSPEMLDHMSSDYGIRELDAQITLQIARTASFTTDSIRPKNLAAILFGSEEALTVAASTVAAEQVGVTGVGVELGMFYQLGATTSNPSGARGVSSVVLSTTGGTPAALVLGVDYLVDSARGRIEIMETSPTVETGDILSVAYSVLASTRSRIVSGAKPVEGALRYIADNPEGDDFDYYIPHAKLSADGSFELKSDEWQTLPFTVGILRPDPAMPAILVDGQPLFA